MIQTGCHCERDGIWAESTAFFPSVILSEDALNSARPSRRTCCFCCDEPSVGSSGSIPTKREPSAQPGDWRWRSFADYGTGVHGSVKVLSERMAQERTGRRVE